MSTTIEAMAERDVEAIARLRLAAFFAGTGRTLPEDAAGLRELFVGDGMEAAFVARDQGLPIGSCLLVRDEIDPAHDLTPWLAGLIVDQDHRGRGIGTALVRAVEAHAASAGVGKLYLYTWQARRFYEALGWVEVQTFAQDGGPMALMSRAL
ncbi:MULTISPECIES: GNAT family N-acetyltransferase [unclassified Mesorhizobium]|uniref:GNAT family N-acetyltransferase n=1 Tax=unclassified Mesorhizobium TaxID=325217 RepID=UPI0003CE1A9E|nr:MULTISPECIES: GNAT family N-acetyltransferase [unclassified Mesorhizobium]ESX94164.1 acetyltransferase [Mesorhizobium sp. LNJC403B00]ESZ66531.1 acetyltransferase [Mesorhizobium sp. L103C120A0]WJI46737.1 GNAT family N-acetyltransferase [Mesorhizobium sp. C120A]